MPNLNKTLLMGNLTRDPEVKYTPKGTAVCSFGMAINRRYTTEGGEAREETTFVDVTFFAKSAEVIGEYVKKGHPLYVEGRLQLDQWDDKATGQKRSKLHVIGENFQFLKNKEAGENEDRTDRSREYDQSRPERPTRDTQAWPQRPPPRPPTGSDAPLDDDDIPF